MKKEEQSCVFCSIVAGTIPSHKVFENDLFYGFLDIRPRVIGHSLVIPKKHYTWVYDVVEFGAYWEAALALTRSLHQVLRPKFVTYGTHGLEVAHAHIHVMPRGGGDTSFFPSEIKMDETSMSDLASKVSAVSK